MARLKVTESLHLQFLFTLQRLAFMTRHQFFPACPPFVNTVYGMFKKNLIHRFLVQQSKSAVNYFPILLINDFLYSLVFLSLSLSLSKDWKQGIFVAFMSLA